MYYDGGLFQSLENRSQLAMFYRDNSMLTFEGQEFHGAKDIVEKFTSLPLMQYQQASRDAQPSAPEGSVVIYIIGQILYEGTKIPQTFSQVVHLVPEASGQWYILNDIFRLVYVGP